MTEYFASLDRDEIGGELEKKVLDYYSYINSVRRLQLWKRSHRQYWRGYFTGGDLLHSGERGERKKPFVNHYKNLLQHNHSLISGQRPAFNPRAANSDSKSIKQTVIARGLLDYYMREQRGEDIVDNVLKLALYMGEGWATVRWDESAGQPYSPNEDGSEEVKTGDLRFGYHNPFDVIRDISIEDLIRNNWYIVREKLNKHELAAEYPDYKEDILNSTSIDIGSDLQREINLDTETKEHFSDDSITVYTFWHKKNASLPEGRQTIFLSGSVILSDGPLPYKDIPLYNMFPEEQDNIPFGYTNGFDLLALQKVYDMVIGMITTNANAYGVQNVLMPAGSGMNVRMLTEGLRAIPFNYPMKPEILNLLQIPGTMFEFLDRLERLMETISGVNSVARGNPPSNLKSGTAIAFVQQQALQFNSNLAKGYALFLESFGTGIVNILKEYAHIPRIIAIAGRYNQSYVKSFKRDDIMDIDRVLVDLGNPVMQTAAGRAEVAENLIKMGAIKDPDQYLEIIQSGNLETVLEGQTSILMYVRQENEDLLADDDGVIAAMTDDHYLHIKKHSELISNRDLREDPIRKAKVLNHIQEHINLLKTGDPSLLKLLGQQPIAPPMPPPGPGGLMPPPPNMSEITGGQGMPSNLGPVEPMAPNQPKNPMTGQPVPAPM